MVPIVFAVEADTIYSAVDAKPKRHLALRRLANVTANPVASVLVDHYDDADWTALWWVRADGVGRVLAPEEPEARHGVGSPGGPLSAAPSQCRRPVRCSPIDVERWSSWSASQ